MNDGMRTVFARHAGRLAAAPDRYGQSPPSVRAARARIICMRVSTAGASSRPVGVGSADSCFTESSALIRVSGAA